MTENSINYSTANRKQALVNKAIGFNQVIKVVALSGKQKSLRFDELKKEPKLLEVIDKKPIKPISYKEQYDNKVYKFRLKPGRYLIMVSTKRKDTISLDFSLIEVYLAETNKFSSDTIITEKAHVETIEYPLIGLIETYNNVKKLFNFSEQDNSNLATKSPLNND